MSGKVPLVAVSAVFDAAEAAVARFEADPTDREALDEARDLLFGLGATIADLDERRAAAYLRLVSVHR